MPSLAVNLSSEFCIRRSYDRLAEFMNSSSNIMPIEQIAPGILEIQSAPVFTPGMIKKNMIHRAEPPRIIKGLLKYQGQEVLLVGRNSMLRRKLRYLLINVNV